MEKNILANNPDGSPHRGGDAQRAEGVLKNLLSYAFNYPEKSAADGCVGSCSHREENQ